jgi:hypothetical protein
MKNLTFEVNIKTPGQCSMIVATQSFADEAIIYVDSCVDQKCVTTFFSVFEKKY